MVGITSPRLCRLWLCMTARAARRCHVRVGGGLKFYLRKSKVPSVAYRFPQLLAVFLHSLPSEPGCTIIAAVARRLARRNTSYLGERALHNNIFNFDMKGPYFTKIWVHSCPQSYLDTSQGAYRCPCTSVTLDRFVLTTTHYNSPQLTSAVAGQGGCVRVCMREQ